MIAERLIADFHYVFYSLFWSKGKFLQEKDFEFVVFNCLIVVIVEPLGHLWKKGVGDRCEDVVGLGCFTFYILQSELYFSTSEP